VFCSVLYVVMCSCMFSMAICVFVCYTREFVLFGLLGGCMHCMFQVATRVSVSLRWQYVLLYVLGGNVCCCMF